MHRVYELCEGTRWISHVDFVHVHCANIGGFWNER